MSDEIIKWFYKDTDYKRYKDYRLLSIYGTILEINNTEKLRDKFGYIENQTIKVARAKATGLYDVENDMILTSVIMLRRKIQLKDITKFEWIIELKYIKESDRNTLEKVKDQGLKQLQMYGESKMVQDELDKEGLKKVLIIVVGKKDIYSVSFKLQIKLL
ncbi:PD-(D/E)XK nuclease domain-containing protein [Clostridium sp.]|uniref:PD-(D/E)XK nuclease domain-containing protein n=1 Tax=Clostridium sp. TaxID=1506 RepID=UPI003D6CD91E